MGGEQNDTVQRILRSNEWLVIAITARSGPSTGATACQSRTGLPGQRSHSATGQVDLPPAPPSVGGGSSRCGLYRPGDDPPKRVRWCWQNALERGRRVVVSRHEGGTMPARTRRISQYDAYAHAYAATVRQREQGDAGDDLGILPHLLALLGD